MDQGADIHSKGALSDDYDLAEIVRIVDLQLRRLEKLLGDRKITVEVTADAKKVIVSDG